MVNPVSGASNAANAANRAEAVEAAVRLIQSSRTGVAVNTDRLAAGLQDLARSDPSLAGQVRAQVENRLTTVERGQLDARLGSNDNAAAAAAAGPDPATLTLDVTQMALDIVGIFDPTPISDGSNAVISLFRGDFGGAAISAAGILPVIGDAAKLGKLGKWGETVANAVEMAARNPAFAKVVEPALRRISDAIAAAPLDKLPASARTALEGIRTKIDDLVQGGASAAAASIRNADGSLNMDAAAARYGEVVGSNRRWSWGDNFDANVTAGERVAIRREAIERGLIPDVALKPGTRYADFASAGLVRKVDALPQNLWTASDKAQFDFLDARIPGGRPEGFTWHHTETPGRMELVPFGPHNTINHVGGRSPGHWAHAPR